MIVLYAIFQWLVDTLIVPIQVGGNTPPHPTYMYVRMLHHSFVGNNDIDTCTCTITDITTIANVSQLIDGNNSKYYATCDSYINVYMV